MVNENRPHQRIEMNINPIEPALFDVLRTIRDTPSSTLQEKQLAICCLHMGLALNELLGKLEYGDVIISNNISEKPLSDFIR
ncbi:hypothetical protein [Schlesneria sp. T3-172]|uniref:hypothetical protein n=1 Tax=Schlesneria sphaerica TaxID=3373610 RepID=UPI0037C9B627